MTDGTRQHGTDDAARSATPAAETARYQRAQFPSQTHRESTDSMFFPLPLPDPTLPIADQEPMLLLAMCIFGEARGQSDLARRAVAQVIINRARHPHPVFGSRTGEPFDHNLRRVILQPQQFSSFNSSDPNHAKLLRPLDCESPATWRSCVRCAEDSLAARDAADTLTFNSDHYFDDSIHPPAWASAAKQTVKIGRLNFYRLYLAPPYAERVLHHGEPQEPAAGPTHGSLHPANVSDAARTAAVDSPATGVSPLPPSTSLSAPKSPRAHISGPEHTSRMTGAEGSPPEPMPESPTGDASLAERHSHQKAWQAKVE